MFSEIKKLAKQSAIYGVGQVISPLLGFILLPVYTRFLDVDEYGVYQLTSVVGMFLTAIMGLGINSGLVRIYFTYDSDEDKNKVISTCIYFSTVSSLLFAIVIWFISPYVSPLLFEVPNSDYLLKLLSITLIFQIVGGNMLGVLRAEEKASLYTGFTVFTLVLSLSLNILFVAVFDRKIEGLLEAQLITNALNTIILFPLTMRGKKITYSNKIIKEVMAFGAPLIPALVADMVLSMADRYFINYYADSAQVGLYSLGYRIAAMITVVISKPFKIAWPPYMFRVAKQENAKEIYKIVLVYFVFAAVWFGLALSVISREILVVLTTPQYYDAYTIVPLIVLSYVLFGMVSILIAGIHITKKTKYGAIFTIVSASVNTVLNFLLIPSMGMMGAAISTIISYIVLNAGIFRYSQKLYPIKHEFGRMGKLFFLGAALYFVSLITLYLDSIVIIIILKVILILSFPVFLILLQFYKPEEKKEINAFYKRAIKPKLLKVVKIGG